MSRLTVASQKRRWETQGAMACGIKCFEGPGGSGPTIISALPSSVSSPSPTREYLITSWRGGIEIAFRLHSYLHNADINTASAPDTGRAWLSSSLTRFSLIAPP
ncbi:hypothetical protein KM043_003449 [Ampulex compressa]|nr:hypothetical protein KM043_003449 [Ampulex compressa]